MSERAPGSSERTYAEWYVWAKRNLSPTSENCHAAAQAARVAQESGQDAMEAARQSAVSRSGPGWESPADAWTRGYAEWFDWARLNLRVDGDTNHQAAAAAINALHSGADPASAMDAARAAVGALAAPAAYPQAPLPAAPPAQQYASPPPYGQPAAPPPPPYQQQQYPAPLQGPPPYGQPGPPPQPYPQPGFAPQGYAQQPYPQPGFGAPAGYPVQADASSMKRSPLRLAILLTICSFPYYVWWMWEVMSLGVKERFPRSKSFWWTLIPFYGYAVVYRVLQDQAYAEASLTGRATLNPQVVIGLILLTTVVNRLTATINTGVASVATYLLAFAFLGGAGYLTQAATNRYLDVRFPGVPTRGMSAGEIVGAVIGLAVLALVVFGSFTS